MSYRQGSTYRTSHILGLLAISAALVALAGCGGGSSSTSTTTHTTPPPTNNVLPVAVTLGPTGSAANALLASVTICTPGTTTCQNIPDVFVDSGSEGLRLLASQATISLPSEKDANGNPLGNCVNFLDNSYIWGPVVTADVLLAGEKTSSVPIQLIGDTNFPSVPSGCNTGGTALDTVMALGANGILGVGVFQQDCGPACAQSVSLVPKVYFSCPPTGCTVASVPVLQQLQNPVWMFPQDNNGVLIDLPAIPDTGAPSVSGSLIFGIGTQSNNALGTASVYTTDSSGNFTTVFDGSTLSASFIDSGSNGLFFPAPSSTILPVCSGAASSFYCPNTTTSFSATNTGLNGTSAAVSFKIANAQNLLSNAANSAFDDLGGPNSKGFDWGLPFFFGRKVFVAIETENTPAGPGPYWAY